MSEQTNNPTEIWETIPEFENYSASSLGRIKRTVSGNKKATSPDGVLKQKGQNSGYLFVSLSKHGVVYTRTVHRLVLISFLGLDPFKTDANHKNGNKTDNRIENLEWMTRSENVLHRAIVLGMDNRGECNPASKLTTSQVSKIRELLCLGIRQRVIAAQFGICQQTVSHINRNMTWAHI